MGNKSGKPLASAENPFPIDNRLESDLDKMSLAAARILATPDIYDVANLAKPGVCGDYAVFMKKNLEKKLLPFVVDLSGTLTEVVYQNPRKAIADIGTRKKICSVLADSMLRTIAIVIACLASIQVNRGTRRKDYIANVPTLTGGAREEEEEVNEFDDGGDLIPIQTGGAVQVGGDINSVYSWLSAAGYVPNASARQITGQEIPFRTPKVQTTDPFTYKLILERYQGAVTYGLVKADQTNVSSVTALPTGALRLEFLNPIQLPIQTANVSVLPMRIVDNAGMTWFAGIFYENVFKSFAARTPSYSITEVIEHLFRRTQGFKGVAIESRDDTARATNVFRDLLQNKNPQTMYRELNDFFSQIAGFQPGFIPQQQVGFVQPGFAGQQGFVQPGFVQPGFVGQQGFAPGGFGGFGPGGFGPGGFGAGGLGAGGLGIARIGGITGVGGIGAPSLQPLQGTGGYDIPIGATRYIIDRLKTFRGALPIDSTPAAARAATLRGREKDRNVFPGLCTDPYWKGNLNGVYPWATLQFLSIKDWSTLQDKSKVVFEDEWKNFVDKLATEVYATGTTGYPRLNRSGQAFFLDQMTIAIPTKIGVSSGKEIPCGAGQETRVAYKEVQDGLLTLQGLYDRHVPKIWNILNSLIYTIEDPDTKATIVRLHPNVTKGVESKVYVDAKAKEARTVIADFYLEVERAYKRAIQSLQPN